MATTVGQHSVASFTSPVNGTTPIDANTVRGNDNTVRSAYVDHDADPGIHVQSSTLAARPTAGTAGRKWITSDYPQKLWYDDGTDWHEVGGDAITIYCKATETIANGDIVKVTGYNTGQDVPEIAKVASASDVAFGIAESAIANGSLGYVVNTGIIQGVATNSFSIGNILYPNTSGGLTTTKPTSGNYQTVAYVLRAHATAGVLYVEFSAPRIVERSDNTASTIVLRDASGNFAAGTITAGALTSTGLVTFASLRGTGATTVTDILNDSTMATASATTLATSSSIKTYVDNKVATVDTLAEVLANGNTTGSTNIIVSAGQKITTDTIDETTSAAGVTIDSVLLKDNEVKATGIKVTNLKANDGTAAGSIADSTGKITITAAPILSALTASQAVFTDASKGLVSNAITGTGNVVMSASPTLTGTANVAALTASGVVTLSAGTAAAPALTTSGDTNNGLFFPAADVTAITTAGTERLRVDASGNLFIGNGESSASPANGVLRGTDGSGTNIAGADLSILGGRGTGSGAGGAVIFSTSAAGSSGTTLRSATERMRVTAAGEVILGGSTSLDAGPGVISLIGPGYGGSINLFRNDTVVAAGEQLGLVGFWGNDSTANTPTRFAVIAGVSSDTHAAGDNPTDIQFQTTPDGTEAHVEAGRITQAGSYVLKGGTTTMAAGVGIIFPATQVASANANSLDDYEEGTWTPAYTSLNAAFTYTGQAGFYTKVGRQVTVICRIVLSGVTGDTYNVIELTGLPFTSVNASGFRASGSIGIASDLATDMPNLRVFLSENASAIQLRKNATNAATSNVLTSDIGTTSTLFVTLTYFTA